MTKTQNIKTCEINVISALLRLLKKNVPALVIWNYKGSVKHIGSEHLTDWFKNLDETTAKALKTKMVEDVINIGKNREHLVMDSEDVPDQLKATSLYKNLTEESHVQHPSGIPLLPYPLLLMSRKDLITYITRMMRREAEACQKKLVFGSNNFIPSCWMESDWPWVNLKQSLSKVKEEMFTGSGTFLEFLARTVQEILVSNNLDAVTHVEDQDGKEIILLRKKRAIGLHEAPKVIRSEEGNEDTENNMRINQNSQPPPQLRTLFLPQEIDESQAQDSARYQTKGGSDGRYKNQESYGHSGLPEPYNGYGVSQSQESDIVYQTQESYEVSQESNMVYQTQGCCTSQPQDGYSSQPQDSYSPQPQDSYSSQPQDSYSSQPQDSYSNQPSESYSSQTQDSYSSPTPDSYRSQTQDGKSSQVRGNPRRTIGISPFKVASNQPNRKIKIPMKKDATPASTQKRKAIVDLPHQVRFHLPGLKQEWNSGGGSCLYKSAAAHINEFGLENIHVTYKELRIHVHKKLVECWKYFENYFGWPTEVTVGAGNNSKQRMIQNPAEYIQFLGLAESLDSYSESEVDLWILSYVLDTTVCALSYNLPEGEGDGHRCQWKFFEGQGTFKERTKFACRPEPIYLLNEHLVHWTRVIVEESAKHHAEESADSKPERRKIKDPKSKADKVSKLGQKLQKTTSPKEGSTSWNQSRLEKKKLSDSKSIKRANKKLVSDKSRRKIEPSKKLEDFTFKVKEVLTVVDQIVDFGEKTPSLDVGVELDEYHTFVTGANNHVFNTAGETEVLCPESGGKHSQDEFGRQGSVAGSKHVMRSQSKQGKGVNLRIKTIHEEVSETPLMPARQDEEVIRAEKLQIAKLRVEMNLLRNELDEAVTGHNFLIAQQIKVQIDRLEEKQALMEDQLSTAKVASTAAQLDLYDDAAPAVTLNRVRRKTIQEDVSEVSEQKLRELFQNNLGYIENIHSGDEYSPRFEQFERGGIHRSALRHMVITSPFTNNQVQVVLKEIYKMIDLKSHVEECQKSDYVWKVLLPESLIKV